MGNSTVEVSEVLAQGSPVKENHTKDVFEFLPVSPSKKIRVKVSVEICGEEEFEDEHTDISIELEEAVTKTMVGRYEFLKRSRYSEYEGDIKLV